MAVLSDDDIGSGLAGLPGWERDGDSIRKEFRLPGFPDAIAFLVRISYEAEAADHHPDVDLRYNRLVVALSTHSEGGITTKDLDLASAIEALADRSW